MHDCLSIWGLLSRKGRISIPQIAEELNMPTWTVRRWLTAFTFSMDLRIEKGIVIIGED
jgi:hypothetical protein